MTRVIKYLRQLAEIGTARLRIHRGSRQPSATLRLVRFGILLCLSISLLAIEDAGEWQSYGHDPDGMRYSPLTQIDRNNVGKLSRVWEYHTGEIVEGKLNTREHRVQAFETTPLVVANVMYLSTASSRVIALDPETGKEIWKYDPQNAPHVAKRSYRAHRGVAYWRSGSEERIVFGTYDARLICLNAKTGKPVPGFGKEGEVNLREGFTERWPGLEYAVTSPPAIYKDLVITGSQVPESPGQGPSGAVRAFDIRTGKLAWRFDTVPRAGNPGSETWDGDSWRDRTGANVWSVMSVDPDRGLVFLPIGSAAYDFYGADRKGKNLFANCLVALDAATGALKWHYQLVHHNVWDYDPPAPAGAGHSAPGRPGDSRCRSGHQDGIRFRAGSRDGTTAVPGRRAASAAK